MILEGKRVRDVANEIALLDANNAPLTVLLMKLRKKKSQDVKFEWFEDLFPAHLRTYVTTAGTESSGDTALTFSSDGEAAYGRPGDLWMNIDTGEVIYITAVASSVWTVIRNVGDSSANPVTGADEWFYIGNAQQTGAVAREKITTQVTNPYNYCQIFKEGWEITATAQATRMYGGDERTNLRKKHGKVHMRDIERSMWWGVRERLDDNSVATTAYMQRGFFWWLSTNAHQDSGSTTEDDFDAFLRQDFRYGNNVKMMFCSPLALSVISSWGRDKLQVVPRDTTFGINITRYISPHGELNLINNKTFYDVNATSDSWYNYGACSAIVDLEYLWYRYLRDTQLRTNIQEPDKDAVEDEFLTECGMELHHEEHHAAIYDWSLT
jgi:hypothetical protein